MSSAIPVLPHLHPVVAEVIDEKKQASSLLVPSQLLSNVQMKSGDLLQSRMQVVVNTVNCVGVMGKGIALEFKKKYPDMFKDYLKKCANKLVRIGEPYRYQVTKDRWIINFPTKRDWRQNSRLEDIENGLKYLAAHISEWKVTSLAIPPLGCSNGKLRWKDVFPLIQKYLYPLQINLEIYAPVESVPKKILKKIVRKGGAGDSFSSSDSLHIPQAEAKAAASSALLAAARLSAPYLPIANGLQDAGKASAPSPLS